MWWLAWNEKYNRPVPTNTTLTYAIDHLYPLFFARFLYETGYYALFPHFAERAQLVLQSEEEKVRTIYAWSQEKEARTRAELDSRPRAIATLPFYSHSLPSLASLPLFDVAGWDANGHLEPDESRQEEEERTEARRKAADVGVGEEEEGDDLGLSKRGNRERSRVLATRPYQWSRSPQCTIVQRDRKAEEAREQATLIGHFTTAAPVLPHLSPAAKPSGGGGAGKAKPAPVERREGEARITPSRLEEDQGEEESVDRKAFLARWKEGGRSGD